MDLESAAKSPSALTLGPYCPLPRPLLPSLLAIAAFTQVCTQLAELEVIDDPYRNAFINLIDGSYCTVLS